MIRIKNIVWTVAAGFLLWNCTKPVPSLSLEKEEIVIDYEGGVVNLKVTCNVETKTTITYDEGEDWVFLMPSHLWGDGVFRFEIKRFSSTEADRHATAKIVGDGVMGEIRITQSHKPKPQSTDLDLNRDMIQADVEGGTWTVAVSCEGDWTAESPVDWCVIEKSSGNGEGSFDLTVAPSTDYQYRTAEITVKKGTVTRTLEVQHVGTKIGDVVWANSNVDDPDTFGANCEVRGKLYQYNSKVPYPSYAANDHCSNTDPVPGFETGAFDVMSEVWAEENDPCPDGWRVPTIDEIKDLIGAEESTPRFWFDYWMIKGRSVAGAYIGLDRVVLQDEVTPEFMMGSIFVAQTGVIDRDSGVMNDWWDVAFWSCTNVGQTWDMLSVWMNGNQDFSVKDWRGSRTGMAVRCIKK